MRRGVNIGGVFDAKRDGAAGAGLQPWVPDAVGDAGFDTVRLPVSWSMFTERAAPFALEAVVLDRVEMAISAALARGLDVIVDVHHFDELAPIRSVNVSGSWLCGCRSPSATGPCPRRFGSSC